MATSTTSLFLLSPSLHNFKNTHKSNLSHNNSLYTFPKSSYPPLISIFTLSNPNTQLFQNPNERLTLFTKTHRNLRVSAVVPEDSAVVSSESAQQLVSVTSDGGDVTSTVITVLLSIAFVALTILTIGVIYISVTDFLQKREKEKFEKEEEEAKKKRSGKKVRVRSRAGPRGFGQKIEDDEDD